MWNVTVIFSGVNHIDSFIKTSSAEKGFKHNIKMLLTHNFINKAIVKNLKFW